MICRCKTLDVDSPIVFGWQSNVVNSSPGITRLKPVFCLFTTSEELNIGVGLPLFAFAWQVFATTHLLSSPYMTSETALPSWIQVTTVDISVNHSKIFSKWAACTLSGMKMHFFKYIFGNNLTPYKFSGHQPCGWASSNEGRYPESERDHYVWPDQRMPSGICWTSQDLQCHL